jgi:alanine dehydrogenase
MSEGLRLTVSAADSAASAVRNADIVVTATKSSRPVFDGRDLTPGVHINAIGANHANKQEIDEAAVERANLIFVDSIAQSKQEAGDLITPFEKQPQRWEQVNELADLVAGKVPGRTSDQQITLFKSNGIASWDLAVAMRVFKLAKERGLGKDVSFFGDKT